MIDARVNANERGFTLVELAIVMMIIGLLIGGILKGQELMQNARVTSTISQAKSFDAAVTTFRDSFNAWPGDMITAQTRLPNCDGTATTECYNGGTAAGTGGDNIVGSANILGAAVAASNEERVQFWRHLLAADLISGVDTSGTVAFGNMLPSAPVGGGWRVGQTAGGAVPAGQGGENVRGGHYLELVGAPGTASAAAVAGSLPLTPSRAAQIDRKMDDGVAIGGAVVGFGPASCFLNTNASFYDEATEVLDCGLYIRIQG